MECCNSIDVRSIEIHGTKYIREDITSPPPDVVEAARRLKDNDYLAILTPDIDDIETVCKWVLSQK